MGNNQESHLLKTQIVAVLFRCTSAKEVKAPRTTFKPWPGISLNQPAARPFHPHYDPEADGYFPNEKWYRS